ncbi:hypothetical protein A2715_02330 [Candidatus Woesebacteria bacterium RIFCSPHIGHO2_01_FULL_39_32]|uniref:Uncharacterized protein n=1 Tax=Candidatus Woesebacteria bacterium RIFCSPLOWO2_01_FULL_39_25 TaxID=1802521 RepID=A0A1F8BJD7_9BACT|nr:MAG: hypothetical protein A2715_02330 [Candidatus Woesebacteria bacterium RIFCSPHIGHO2_01_FULL_39_32]OGM37493.1 MAG: hypothetical protein A3F01_03565 [Candidatus Woesebacteria bacterium RIFCSPHIGHO2_12_FULL_38_11]OGM64176.1 MAG: hypothetical protein A2893_03570 [Candidatus Woesebacteria bacterium RIFCSPLOWO2_01_FULL_39_25]
MKVRGFSPIIILTILLAIVITAGASYYIGVNKAGSKSTPIPAPTINKNKPCTQEAKVCPDGTSVGRVGPNCEFAPCPATETSQDSSKPGWKLYSNKKYGFQISYPDSYQALEDEENLYGWPNAVVLLYSGGQSYDLPIEAWNTKAEYEAKYKTTPNLTVKEVNGKFITLLNANFEEEVDEIIDTFKALE